MAEDKFDVIVVGAGPSGLAAAVSLAKAGLEVAVLERGVFAGSKNVMGGVFYRHPLEEILPDFWHEAPLERAIVEQRLWMLGAHGHTGIAVRSDTFGGIKPNCWTVFRAKFDRWLAQKAEAAGAMILTEATVESLLRENGKVVGVHTNLEDGDLRADVVIIAEGANSLLLRDIGVHPEIKPNQVATAVKEIIALPAGKIEDRFNVEPGQGVTIELFGSLSRGGVGLGFLYANRESISLGIGLLTSDLARLQVKPNDLLEALKEHPSIRPLLASGSTEEYMAHLIPEGGYNAVPRLYGAGWLVVGDAAMLVDSVHREGSNLAVKSGLLAAAAVVRAKENNDFSAAGLASYRNALRDSFVMRDLKKYKGLSHFLESHPHFFTVYPDLINDAGTAFFTVNGQSKREMQRRLLKMIRQRRGLLGLMLDAVQGGLTLQ
ncbi:FAD-dependent oxidoreductase [candidate division FCPU426 bacterium]|nr:FAD-dependent oxidoreductase [candidate division FCPU426 bacterium]